MAREDRKACKPWGLRQEVVQRKGTNKKNSQSRNLRREHDFSRVRGHHLHELELCPEMGMAPGVVPAGLEGGALEAGAESQRELAAMGLGPHLLREMT